MHNDMGIGKPKLGGIALVTSRLAGHSWHTQDIVTQTRDCSFGQAIQPLRIPKQSIGKMWQ